MSNEVVAATTASFVFALLAVGLRLYARIALVKRLYGEDYILTSSFVIALSWWIVKVIGATRDADDGNMRLLAIISWYGTIAWGTASALTKLSIVYQYWRVFEDIKWVRLVCNVLMGFLILYGLYSFFGAIFMCYPVNHAWGAGPGNCANPKIYYFLTSSVNIVADVIIFTLPVKPVLNLKIPLKQRLALLCCFTFGAFVIICSIVRLYWLVEQLGERPNRDVVERVTIWAGIEMMSSIICTCFPVLRPLVTRWFPKLMAASIGSSVKSRLSRHRPPPPQQDKPKSSQESLSGSDRSSGQPCQQHELQQTQYPTALTPPPATMSPSNSNVESRQEQGVAGIPPQQLQPQHGWAKKPYFNPNLQAIDNSSTSATRSPLSPAPPYESQRITPAFNDDLHQSINQTANKDAVPTPGFVPVSPESHYGSFRASNVSELTQGGSYGYRNSSSTFSRNASPNIGARTRSLTPSLTSLRHVGNRYRISGSSSTYSRHSSRSSRGAMSSFGTSTVGSTTSAMNTIVDNNDEEVEDATELSINRQSTAANGKIAEQGVIPVVLATPPPVAVVERMPVFEMEGSVRDENQMSPLTTNTAERDQISPVTTTTVNDHNPVGDTKQERSTFDSESDSDDEEDFICETAAYGGAVWRKASVSPSSLQPRPLTLRKPASAPTISPIKPTAPMVLPPLFFQPEHQEYESYRCSVSQSQLPGFMPPAKKLPEVPTAKLSLRAVGGRGSSEGV